MADSSPIEWTDATWNPVVGCSVLSPGCANCYAMGMAARIEAMTAALAAKGRPGAPHYDGTTKRVKTRGGEAAGRTGTGKAIWTGRLALAPDAILTAPLRMHRPRRIFVNSMGDLFHEDVPDQWIDRVFAIMALSPQHNFQVLTKRSARMREYLTDAAAPARIYDIVMDMVIVDQVQAILTTRETHAIAPPGNKVMLGQWPLPNVWLGVSAERQQEADERIPDLLATQAAIRFVSAEPLLGPIDFTSMRVGGAGSLYRANALTGDGFDGCGLDWVIVGGESGPGARPMHPDWARSLRDQCAAAGVPFFFKQWGSWGGFFDLGQPTAPLAFVDIDGNVKHDPTRADLERNIAQMERGHDGWALMARVTKKRAGRLLDGVEHNGWPSSPLEGEGPKDGRDTRLAQEARRAAGEPLAAPGEGSWS